MSEANKKNEARPLLTIRHGAIGASIWKRQTPNGLEYFDFSISRSWKAKTSGKEGYSPNFFARNEAELTSVIREASGWIASQSASLQPSESADSDAGIDAYQSANGLGRQLE
jgi:hypothetical protein